MVVYVVTYANYGDQGVDFCGVFATREAAQKYINDRFPNDEHEQKWFDIHKEEVQE